MRFFTPSLRRSRYAGTRLFARQGKAQGRRGHRRPPDRFARPPYSSKTPQPGHFAALAVFSSTGRGPEGELPRRGKRSPSGGFSFVKTKENGGGSSAGIPRPPAGQWQRSRYATAPGPLIHPSVRAVHLPPRGGRLSCEGLKRHFRQRRRLIPVCPAGRAKKQETAPRRRRKKIALPENKCRRPRL